MATKPVFKDTDQGPVIRRKLNEMGTLFEEGMANIGDAQGAALRAKQYRDEAEGFKNITVTKAGEAKGHATGAKASELASKDSKLAAAQSEGNAKASELAAKASELASAQSEGNAKASELAAKASELAAKASELASAQSEGNARDSKLAAALSESNAKDSELASKDSETASALSESASALSESKAKDSELASALSETNAKASELASKDSELASALSETNAKASEIAAKDSELAAAQSEGNAKASELEAKYSETASALSETNSKASELASKDSESASALSESKAKDSETASALSETSAKASELAAKASELASAQSEGNAKASELAAAQSEGNAKDSELASTLSETNAKASELASKDSELASALSETNAKASELASKDSELASALSETNAKDSELLAKDWAIKEGGTVDGEEYSAKHYALMAHDVVAGGTVVAHEATDTIEFEGLGSTNIPLKANFVGTKADVGLDQVDNTSDLDKPISTATQLALDLKAGAGDLADLADSVSDTLTPLIDAKVDKEIGHTLYPTEDKTKLEGIESGATKNATDAQLRDRSSHTGEQAISTVFGLQAELDSKVASVVNQGLYPNSDKSKLAGIAVGATKNATDSQLRDRSTHTGEQSISTITELQNELDGKLGISANAVSATKLATARTIAGKSFNGTANISIGAADVGAVPQNGSATLTRYDLTSATATAALNLAQQQVFRVAASTPRTLTFTNAPGANRAMTVVIHITGNKAVTWPAGIDWDEGSAPELGDVFTRVVLFWDGVIWTGVKGVAR